MAVLNKIQLIGYLGHTPRYIKPKSDHIASVSLATNEVARHNGEQVIITEWHNLIFFGTMAFKAMDSLNRGNQLYVEGKLRSHSWIDTQSIQRKSFNVIVESMQLLDKTNCNDLPEQTDKLTPEDYLEFMHSILGIVE